MVVEPWCELVEDLVYEDVCHDVPSEECHDVPSEQCHVTYIEVRGHIKQIYNHNLYPIPFCNVCLTSQECQPVEPHCRTVQESLCPSYSHPGLASPWYGKREAKEGPRQERSYAHHRYGHLPGPVGLGPLARLPQPHPGGESLVTLVKLRLTH